MALPSDNQLDRIETLLTKLLRRKRTQDVMDRTRQNQKVSKLGDQVKQLKVEKIALLKYIKELETYMKLQTEDEKV